MVNLTIAAWEEKLRRHGLLWVGTMNTDYSGRHSRIVEGMTGNGQPNGTAMKIIDPDRGRRSKYEHAFFQIRHY